MVHSRGLGIGFGSRDQDAGELAANAEKPRRSEVLIPHSSYDEEVLTPASLVRARRANKERRGKCSDSWLLACTHGCGLACLLPAFTGAMTRRLAMGIRIQLQQR